MTIGADKNYLGNSIFRFICTWLLFIYIFHCSGLGLGEKKYPEENYSTMGTLADTSLKIFLTAKFVSCAVKNFMMKVFC